MTAGALAAGLAVPSAASADTAQVVYAWGYNNWGQAGADPNVAGTDLLSPVPVHGAAANVTQLSGPNGPYKGRYVLSLRSDGTVWGWGRNYTGVLGDVSGSTFTPVQIQGLPPNIVQISAGGIHAAALAADGSVWTWGGNNVGQLGYPTPGTQYSTVPHQVPGVSGVTQLAAAAEISMALRADGTLLVWGYEGLGLRGDGIPRSTPLPVPTPVTPVPGLTKIALSGSTVLVRAPAVTMPNVVGTLRVSAVAQLQAIGLSVQVSTVPDKPICNNVGTVESQTPPPGTVVAPGGHATIRVYVPPPAGCL